MKNTAVIYCTELDAKKNEPQEIFREWIKILKKLK